jgi:uncharacterized protein with PIN domain
MKQAELIHICFHAELNDFLPRAKRSTWFDFDIKKARSVKDLIESIGIPHTEIDIIIVNRVSVDFNWLIEGGESIEVYPFSHDDKLNITPITHNQPEITNIRFVLDVHLGRLAGYLRMLGFDTLYRNDYDDTTLAHISDNEQRILLTRDRALLMRKQVSRGYYMRSQKPRHQVTELLNRYQLSAYRSPSARCMNCNGIIHDVQKQDIESQLLPLTRQHYDHFYQCEHCKKIYWEGSHYDRMQGLINQFRSQ